MDAESQENGDNALKRDEKGRLVKGTPPGPGRPTGSISIKNAVKKHLEDHPEDFKEFVDHFIKQNRELAWQMLEGRPPQKTDITTDDKPIIPLLVKFIDEKSNGNTE